MWLWIWLLLLLLSIYMCICSTGLGVLKQMAARADDDIGGGEKAHGTNVNSHRSLILSFNINTLHAHTLHLF